MLWVVVGRKCQSNAMKVVRCVGGDISAKLSRLVVEHVASSVRMVQVETVIVCVQVDVHVANLVSHRCVDCWRLGR